MKYLIFALTVLVLLACNTPQNAQTVTPGKPGEVPSAPSTPAPFVTWDKKMVDLGKVKKGEKRTLFFELTNTSAAA